MTYLDKLKEVLAKQGYRLKKNHNFSLHCISEHFDEKFRCGGIGCRECYEKTYKGEDVLTNVEDMLNSKRVAANLIPCKAYTEEQIERFLKKS